MLSFPPMVAKYHSLIFLRKIYSNSYCAISSFSRGSGGKFPLPKNPKPPIPLVPRPKSPDKPSLPIAGNNTTQNKPNLTFVRKPNQIGEKKSDPFKDIREKKQTSMKEQYSTRENTESTVNSSKTMFGFFPRILGSEKSDTAPKSPENNTVFFHNDSNSTGTLENVTQQVTNASATAGFTQTQQPRANSDQDQNYATGKLNSPEENINLSKEAASATNTSELLPHTNDTTGKPSLPKGFKEELKATAEQHEKRQTEILDKIQGFNEYRTEVTKRNYILNKKEIQNQFVSLREELKKCNFILEKKDYSLWTEKEKTHVKNLLFECKELCEKYDINPKHHVNYTRDIEEYKHMKDIIERKGMNNTLAKLLLENFFALESIATCYTNPQRKYEIDRLKEGKRLLEDFSYDTENPIFHEICRRSGVTLNNDAMDSELNKARPEGEGSVLNKDAYKIMEKEEEKYLELCSQITRSDREEAFDNALNNNFFVAKFFFILPLGEPQKQYESTDERHLQFITHYTKNGEKHYLAFGFPTSNKDSGVTHICNNQPFNDDDTNKDKHQGIRICSRFMYVQQNEFMVHENADNFFKTQNYVDAEQREFPVNRTVLDTLLKSKSFLLDNDVRRPHNLHHEKMRSLAIDFFQIKINNLQILFDKKEAEYKTMGPRAEEKSILESENQNKKSNNRKTLAEYKKLLPDHVIYLMSDEDNLRKTYKDKKDFYDSEERKKKHIEMAEKHRKKEN